MKKFEVVFEKLIDGDVKEAQIVEANSAQAALTKFLKLENVGSWTYKAKKTETKNVWDVDSYYDGALRDENSHKITIKEKH